MIMAAYVIFQTLWSRDDMLSDVSRVGRRYRIPLRPRYREGPGDQKIRKVYKPTLASVLRWKPRPVGNKADLGGSVWFLMNLA